MKVEASARPTNFADALRAQGLTRVELTQVKRDMTHTFGERPTVRGRELVVIENGGWHGQRSVFARRGKDGLIVLVSEWPNKIVDGHRNAGCMTFAGGRAWFEEATYRLPEGATFGGVVKVEYDDHVIIDDYSDRSPDGSPCPPPAID